MEDQIVSKFDWMNCLYIYVMKTMATCIEKCMLDKALKNSTVKEFIIKYGNGAGKQITLLITISIFSIA